MVEQIFGIDLKIIMKFLIDFIDIKYKSLFKKKYKFWLKIVDILIVILKKIYKLEVIGMQLEINVLKDLIYFYLLNF